MGEATEVPAQVQVDLQPLPGCHSRAHLHGLPDIDFARRRLLIFSLERALQIPAKRKVGTWANAKGTVRFPPQCRPFALTHPHA